MKKVNRIKIRTSSQLWAPKDLDMKNLIGCSSLKSWANCQCLMSRQCCATLAIFKLLLTVKKSIRNYQFLNNIPVFRVKSNKVKEFVENCEISPFIWAKLEIKIGDFEQKMAFSSENKIDNTVEFSCATGFLRQNMACFFQEKKF